MKNTNLLDRLSISLSNFLCDSPKAVLCVALFLVNIGRLPRRLDRVLVFPEVDKKVGDLSCRRQDALQVELEVAGKAEAARWDNRCFELQTFFHTESESWERQRMRGRDRLFHHRLGSRLINNGWHDHEGEETYLLNHIESSVCAGGPKYGTSQVACTLQRKGRLWVIVRLSVQLFVSQMSLIASAMCPACRCNVAPARLHTLLYFHAFTIYERYS